MPEVLEITESGDYTGQTFGAVTVTRGAWVTFTNCTFQSLAVIGASFVDLAGTTTIQGWTGNDALAVLANGHVNLKGNLNITGTGTGWGIHVGYHSRFICYEPNSNVTIYNTQIGCQLGLHGLFQHRGPGSTITLNHPAPRVANTYAVQGTDQSSWSTDQTLVVWSFQYAFDLNSLSYAEATGPKQITNCQANARASQNSVVWLP